MEREIVIEGRPFRFACGGNNQQQEITTEGKTYTVRYVPLPDGRRLCLVSGRVVEWNASGNGDLRLVRSGGVLSFLRVADPRRRRRGAAFAAASGTTEIKAPMPGRVTAVLCEVGQQVAAQAGIVVLEAMKMENELRTPVAGVVAALDVEPGESIETGERLAVIEPLPTEDN